MRELGRRAASCTPDQKMVGWGGMLGESEHGSLASALQMGSRHDVG